MSLLVVFVKTSTRLTSELSRSDHALEQGNGGVVGVGEFEVESIEDGQRGVESYEVEESERPHRETEGRHGVVHVLNNWSMMPSVNEQMQLAGSETSDSMVAARFLLKPGRSYEEALAHLLNLMKQGWAAGGRS